MKIALYLDSRAFGGIETHISHLIDGILASGAQVELLLHQVYDPHHPLIRRWTERIPVIDLSASPAALYNYLKQTPVLLHCHGYKANILGRVAGLLSNTPVVTTFHNGDPGSGRVAFYNRLDRLLARLSHNICVSDKIRRTIHGKKHSIPNFIAMPTLPLNFNKRTQVAFVGRLSAEKGPELFADICQELKYECAIYGSGPLYRQIKTASPGIKLYGQVEMEKHWQKVRLLVITSRYEGLPLAALEAMARGIPVISSKAGDLPRLMQQSGLNSAFDVSQPDAFRQAIHHWMSCSEQQYRNNAHHLREFIAQHHSLHACLPATLAVYQQAMNSRSNKQLNSVMMKWF